MPNDWPLKKKNNLEFLASSFSNHLPTPIYHWWIRGVWPNISICGITRRPGSRRVSYKTAYYLSDSEIKNHFRQTQTSNIKNFDGRIIYTRNSVYILIGSSLIKSNDYDSSLNPLGKFQHRKNEL